MWMVGGYVAGTSSPGESDEAARWFGQVERETSDERLKSLAGQLIVAGESGQSAAGVRSIARGRTSNS